MKGEHVSFVCPLCSVLMSSAHDGPEFVEACVSGPGLCMAAQSTESSLYK